MNGGKMNFIGRDHELIRMAQIFNKKQASILVFYGRRRVGKTELIETFLKGKKYIKIEGKEGQSKSKQIQHALYTLSKKFNDANIAKLAFKSWTEVFDFIAQKTKNSSWTIYLEELQWLANYKSDLISDLKEVWDNTYKKNLKLRLVLCGSSPSFMISEVIKSKALYNRSEYVFPIQEFSLQEIAIFFKNKKSNKHAMDAMLTVGGLPEYLKYLEANSSIIIGLSENSFAKGSFFSQEYEKIFTSSMSENKHYKKIIELLSDYKFLTKNEIAKKLKITAGGELSKILQDLEVCGFIEYILPYSSESKKRLVRYAISDNYLQFFNKFIRPRLKDIQSTGIKNYKSVINQNNYYQWLGYSFERWCRRNHRCIAEILGFESVSYQSGAYFNKSHLDTNFQIDLLFSRKDQVMTVCEIKYNINQIGSKIISEFDRKLSYLKVKNNITIEKVLICASEIPPHVEQYFDRCIPLNDFFR
jgi:uncharacterized protein